MSHSVTTHELTSLFETPVAGLANRMARRELSSREVVADCLARIDAVNPHLNAIVQLRAEAALAEASAADRELDRHGRRGPLHGVPFTVKDWIDAAGLPCTGGALAHRDRIPTRDATVVARRLGWAAIRAAASASRRTAAASPA